jgi:hypothetical protein
MFKQVTKHIGNVAASASLQQEKTIISLQDAFYDYDTGPIDNASLLCPVDAVVCSDTVFEMILRWSKLVVLKLARSYHALPIILVALPLTVGLVIGIWWGSRQKERQTAFKDQPKEREAFPETKNGLRERETVARNELKSQRETVCESGVQDKYLPKHIAVIMDGNRRYGETLYGKATAGHWDGSRKVLEVSSFVCNPYTICHTIYSMRMVFISHGCWFLVAYCLFIVGSFSSLQSGALQSVYRSLRCMPFRPKTGDAIQEKLLRSCLYLLSTVKNFESKRYRETFACVFYRPKQLEYLAMSRLA